MVFNSTLGKAVGAGQLLGDKSSDLVFLNETSANFVINIVAGAQSLTRNQGTPTRQITIAKSGFSNSIADVQVQLLDWTGASSIGGDGLSEIVVTAKPVAGNRERSAHCGVYF